MKIKKFIRGFIWGMAAAVVVSGIAIIVYNLTLDCMPALFASKLSCVDEPENVCSKVCGADQEGYFFVLFYFVLSSFILFPLGLGIKKLRD